MNTAIKPKNDKRFLSDLCMFYYQIEDFEHAMQTAEQILKERQDDCTAYLVMGLVSEKKRNFEEAALYYSEILKLHENDPIALKRKANVEMVFGMYEEALADIDQSLSSDKTDPEAYVIRGLIYLRHHHDKIEAIVNFNEALRLDPQNVPALYHRGYSFLKYGNYNYARDDLTHAAILGNKDAEEMLSKFFASHEFKTPA